MGVINHNALIATTWSKEKATAFREWLLANLSSDRFLESVSTTNGYITFFFPPDGSKEGWAESDAGDRIRDLVVSRLALDNYEDDSSPWDWVEVGFGEYGQKVLRGNCINRYDDTDYYE